MNQIRFIYRSLVFYWKSHLAVMLGVAICTMVITGALIVGDSVQSSLMEATELRLGKIDYVFSGTDRYFRASLADEIESDPETLVAPILQLPGLASSQGGKLRLNNVQVVGINEDFQKMMSATASLAPPLPNEAYISENLSNRLQIEAGDAFLLRVEKASQMPVNAPFVSDKETYISVRLKVSRVLSAAVLGRFNLKTSQTAPFNIFVELPFLNEKMLLSDKANHLLIRTNSGKSELLQSINANWAIDDLGLHLQQVEGGQKYEITSERIFMDSLVSRAAANANRSTQNYLTYMVNSIKLNFVETPYSFIAAGGFSATRHINDNEIVVNHWLADDLNAHVGDTIEISYFRIGPLRKLEEQQATFIIVDIVEMKDEYADRSLMPDLPGMTEAGSCRDWEAGVPINFEKIRDKDEAYWNDYRGTPKAFITYKAGRKLWENRFGICTSIRFPAASANTGDIKRQLAQELTPNSKGFKLREVKREGLNAARGGVDFGQLFMALSFFLLLAAIILMALLFGLHLEKRFVEIGTLKALGYARRTIEKIILNEALFVTLAGALLGALMGVAYNKLIFAALNTIWNDIVMTDILQEAVLVKTLFTGITASIVLAVVTIWFRLKKKFRQASRSLQSNIFDRSGRSKQGWPRLAAFTTASMAIGLVLYEAITSQSLSTGVFFMVGTLMLICFVLVFWITISGNQKSSTGVLTRGILIKQNLSRNRARSMRIMVMFALGTFITISTGLNKKDLYSNANQQKSGTGGFHWYLETTLPILYDLNVSENQQEAGIEHNMSFVQLRKNEGDDASCLNLNRVASPRILGIPSEKFRGRFTFIQRTDDLNADAPWESLANELPDGIISAVIDQTVIQWGLGKKVGDTLIYANESGSEMKLKIVGGLANSIFQGNVLIDEQLFLKHFPSNSGAHIMLVDGNTDNLQQSESELKRAFRNIGLEIQLAADRLAMFNQVENTYLTIFLLLGGLAMILGTIGLGISLARNILDRGSEIGILRAIGFTQTAILRIISYEHVLLLLAGTLAGLLAAFIATLPSILSSYVPASWQTALLIASLIVLNGLFWIVGITRSYLQKDVLLSLKEE
jgi:putative ABC transport system permease protein